MSGRPRINPDYCVVDGCGNRAVCKERCDKHYRQWRRDSGAVPRVYRRNAGCSCLADGCDLPAERRGYCGTHYARIRRNGDLIMRRAPNGAGHVRPESGRIVTTKNGITQHRARHIMEEHLGRRLYPDESVHHKNGIVTDDRPENLELRARYHGSGQSVGDLVNWAHEILRRYEALWAEELRERYRR